MQQYNENLKKKVSEEIRQYVSFRIGNEMFGIEVMKVQEVLGQVELTAVPGTMPFMKGVIDLRGVIVPVIDLRLKFKALEKQFDRDSVIIIAEIKGILAGFIVDSVSDVISLSESEVQRTPHFSTEVETDSVEGIAKYNDKIIIILEVDRIFRAGEIEQMIQGNR